jgi:hypothetical protein
MKIILIGQNQDPKLLMRKLLHHSDSTLAAEIGRNVDWKAHRAVASLQSG